MKLSRRTKTILELVFAAAIIILALVLSRIAIDNEFVKQEAGRYGYMGVFILAVISGFNLVIPVPAISFLPLLLIAGLDKWMVIFVISFGMTIADSAAYFLGRIGRKTIKKHSESRIAHFKEIYKNHHWTVPITLFLFASIIPLPNELLIVPLAILGCKLKDIIPPVFLGNLAFNIMSGIGLLSLTSFF